MIERDRVGERIRDAVDGRDPGLDYDLSDFVETEKPQQPRGEVTIFPPADPRRPSRWALEFDGEDA